MSQYDISYHPNGSYLTIKIGGENAKKWELHVVNENIITIVIMKYNMRNY